jgi:precorrin-3B synthase
VPLAGAGRTRADECPGALAVHLAADGGLARVRLPGGAVTTAQLRELAASAAELGAGTLELTSRANVQIRGLAPGSEIELAERLAAAGVLPSASHERARNIVASPLSGVEHAGVGHEGAGTGFADVAPLAVALDRALCGRPRLAELSGRFLFVLDDGRGDVAGLGADVTVVASQRDRGRLTPGGVEVSLHAVVDAMLSMAEAFLDERDAQGSQAWRIAELAGGSQAVAGRALGVDPVGEPAAPAATPANRSIAAPIGVVADGRALVVAVPLGRMTSAQAELLAAAAGPDGLRITPWRSIVVLGPNNPGALVAVAGEAGLGVGADSPWYLLSACTGRPGCVKALADVQADARADASRWLGRKVHWSGCSRGCGRPHDTEVDVVATEAGYQVTGHPEPPTTRAAGDQP